MRLRIAGLSVHIDTRLILSDVELTAEPGKFVALVGPNGSGKTTLLRTVYRALRPTTGVISLDGEDLWDMRPRQAARCRAILTQYGEVGAELSVAEVVAMGRTPHKSLLDRENNTDRAIIETSLERVGMGQQGSRLFSALSGGERQRALLARALAQQAPLLVLDEPTNHLDVRAQLDLLNLIRALGLTLLAALHDLDHAAAYSDHVIVLDKGRLADSGPPMKILTPELIADVFGVRAHVGPHPITGRPHITVAPLPG